MARGRSRYGSLQKVPTGISGLDEITMGGLPKGRPTLVIGNAGSGKTMFAMEFLVRGASEYGEPGVFVCFEETPKDLAENFASRNWNLRMLEERKQIRIEYIYLERSEIEETGEYDLEGLFIRLGDAIDSLGAKRVVLDTIEVLFSGLSNTAILRAELRRLFRWLKEKGVTAIITGERGEGALSRYGLEEYVADCVFMLDHRVTEQAATRRLRIVKYRGSAHGTNEYPFLIADSGISIVPITSLGLEHDASVERIPTGVPGLDEMMGNEGYFRGTSVLVSGTAGTGKTSLAVAFADAACRRGEKCLYFAFEESPKQILRNMRSIGCDLDTWVKKGLLVFHAGRPTQYGLEAHLIGMMNALSDVSPSAVVVDPISNMMSVGESAEVKSMLMRLIDFLKSRNVTSVYTSLVGVEEVTQAQETGISSLMDTWLAVRNIERDGERSRVLHVLKSRGMAHSNRVREFMLSNEGMKLVDIYLGPDGVLVGAARRLQEARDRMTALTRRQEKESMLAELDNKRELLEAKIAAMHAEFEAEGERIRRTVMQDEARTAALARDLAALEDVSGPAEAPGRSERPAPGGAGAGIRQATRRGRPAKARAKGGKGTARKGGRR